MVATAEFVWFDLFFYGVFHGGMEGVLQGAAPVKILIEELQEVVGGSVVLEYGRVDGHTVHIELLNDPTRHTGIPPHNHHQRRPLRPLKHLLHRDTLLQPRLFIRLQHKLRLPSMLIDFCVAHKLEDLCIAVFTGLNTRFAGDGDLAHEDRLGPGQAFPEGAFEFRNVDGCSIDTSQTVGGVADEGVRDENTQLYVGLGGV